MQDPSLLSQLFETELLSFYGWWQLLSCFFAFVALLAIWWHIGRKQKDFGQVWLALSVLCWSFSGAVEVYFAQQFRSAAQELTVYQSLDQQLRFGEVDQAATAELSIGIKKLVDERNDRKFIIDGWRSILSLLNSLFILLALPCFRHIPGSLEFLIKSRAWFPFVFLAFLICLLAIISTFVMGKSSDLVVALDVIYAIVPTLPFLGWILWESFDKRGLHSLAWLAVLCIGFTTITQACKMIAPDDLLMLLSAVFKVALIMIFFALALSWVKEISEHVSPLPNPKLSLAFDRYKTSSGKMAHYIQLGGIPGLEDVRIALTNARFELLHKFASLKKRDEEGWLEIKPKNDSRPNKVYDIQSHNQLIRLLASIEEQIDQQQPMETDSEKLDRKQLKNLLFETSTERDRLIRLRIPSERISLLDAQT